MKKLIFILCLLIIMPACAPARYNKDYRERRGLMLLQPEEYSRNQPLKYSKSKSMKKLHKKIKKRDKR